MEITLPNSTESEEHLVGSVFLCPDLLSEVINIVSPAEFYNQYLGEVFALQMRYAEENKDINPIHIAEEFRSLPSPITPQYLINLQKGIPVTNAFVRQCAKVIKDKASKRKLLKKLNSLQKEIDSDTFENVLQKVDSEIEPFRGQTVEYGFHTFNKVADSVLEEIEDWKKGVSHAIPTGLKSLDRALRGGGRPKQFHIWAAPPSRGKSAWLKQLLYNVASNGYPVILVTAEMSEQEFFFRMLSPLAKVPVYRMDIGLESNNYKYMEWNVPKIANLPIWVDDRTTDIFTLKANIRSLTRQYFNADKEYQNEFGKPWVIAFDYLQLLKATSESLGRMVLNRTNVVAEVARQGKNISKEFNAWVIGLSQFNRAGTKENEDGEKDLWTYNLAETSELENAADMVGILDMDEYEIGNPIRNATAVVAKYRHGIAGREIKIPLRFNGDYMVYEDVLSESEVKNIEQVETDKEMEEKATKQQEQTSYQYKDGMF